MPEMTATAPTMVIPQEPKRKKGGASTVVIPTLLGVGTGVALGACTKANDEVVIKAFEGSAQAKTLKNPFFQALKIFFTQTGNEEGLKGLGCALKDGAQISEETMAKIVTEQGLMPQLDAINARKMELMNSISQEKGIKGFFKKLALPFTQKGKELKALTQQEKQANKIFKNVFDSIKATAKEIADNLDLKKVLSEDETLKALFSKGIKGTKIMKFGFIAGGIGLLFGIIAKSLHRQPQQ